MYNETWTSLVIKYIVHALESDRYEQKVFRNKLKWNIAIAQENVKPHKLCKYNKGRDLILSEFYQIDLDMRFSHD